MNDRENCIIYFRKTIKMDILNSIELLVVPFKWKIKSLMTVVKVKYPNLAAFETKRSTGRQKRLVDNNKSWTMKSLHLVGKAVDFVFLNKKGQPTRTGDYKYLHYVGYMCWVTPIIVKGKLLEQCHLQDTDISIQDQIAINSDRWHKATEQWEKDLLHAVNNELRKYI